MKTICSLIFFLLAFQSVAQTPDYFANDPRWGCGSWSSNSWAPPYIATSESYVYYLNGQEDFAGHTYHKLFKKGQSTQSGNQFPDSTYDVQSHYYLRQEDKSIRFYTSQNGVDKLLVSYNYEIGDTVKGEIFEAYGYINDTIQKIDSVLVNTEYRKMFYLDSINGPVITEGIGAQLTPNQYNGEFIVPIGEGAGFSYSINCFGFGDTPYWDSGGNGGNCALNIGISENEVFSFDYYPNPAHDKIQISLPDHHEIEVRLLSISGEVVLLSKQNSIDLSDISKGIYILEVLDKTRKKLGRERLVIH